MEINDDIIKHVASVARINLTEEEIKNIEGDIKGILESFKRIEEVDVSLVEPSFQPIEVKNVFREDKILENQEKKDILSNVQEMEEGYIKGPKAIE